MTPLSRITLLGRALYGDRWKSQVARDIGVDERLVRFWLDGFGEPTEQHVKALKQAAQSHVDRVVEAMGDDDEDERPNAALVALMREKPPWKD